MSARTPDQRMDAGAPAACAILRLPTPTQKTLDASARAARALFEVVAGRVVPAATLWVLARNGYDQGELVPWPFRLQAEARAAGWLAKNRFIVYDEEPDDERKPIVGAYSSALMLVRDLKRYAFHKDTIREPHIYRDLEWGKRAEGRTGYHSGKMSPRYPDRGRDPGNVFFKDRRNAEGVVQDVFPIEPAAFLKKLLDLSTQSGDRVIAHGLDSVLEAQLTKCDRVPVTLEVLA